MKATAMILGMLLAAPAAARPTDAELFCHDLERVVEAARYGNGFSDLERSRARPPSLGFPLCQATGDERKQYWLCGQSFAPVEMGRDALAARIAACLPEAVRGPASLARDALFTLPYARIQISELGGPGAHVGRIVELVVEAVDQGPAAPPASDAGPAVAPPGSSRTTHAPRPKARRSRDSGSSYLKTLM
jgi:hypothetical protein